MPQYFDYEATVTTYIKNQRWLLEHGDTILEGGSDLVGYTIHWIPNHSGNAIKTEGANKELAIDNMMDLIKNTLFNSINNDHPHT